AAKGPLDEPRRIGSWDEFVDIYGPPPPADAGYLARSVEAFFSNGGPACYVVRIAHRVKDGDIVGPDHASSAERIITDRWDKPTLRVRARNEGRWATRSGCVSSRPPGPRRCSPSTSTWARAKRG